MLLREKFKNSKMMFGMRRHKVGAPEGASWAVSYVDMLTLLLCFFIIFYNLKPDEQNSKSKENQEKTQTLSSLQKIALSIQSTVVGAQPKDNATAGGVVSTQSNAETHTTDITLKAGNESPITKSMNQIRSQIGNLGATDTQKIGETLEVNFKGISFFDTGSIKLTPEAVKLVDRVVAILKPSMNSIHITVQGHTDTRAVKNAKKNITDNWELSVLRATSVLKRFASEGFNQETLSAEGFAATRVLASDSSDLASQRKITLRIEPREEAK